MRFLSADMLERLNMSNATEVIDNAGQPGAWEADVHAIAIPAGTFTGDFYHTARDGDRFRFAIGDVTGKGLRAAVIMAMIQETLESRLAGAEALSDVVEEINQFLLPELRGNRFASLVIGELRGSGELLIVNAGHPPPLLIRRNKTVETLSSTGPVTGILTGAHWCTFNRHLETGESLVLYTDGVLEAVSVDGEEFGLERIGSAVSTAENTATHAARALVASVRSYQGSPRSQDDLTVLVVRRLDSQQVTQSAGTLASLSIRAPQSSRPPLRGKASEHPSEAPQQMQQER